MVEPVPHLTPIPSPSEPTFEPPSPRMSDWKALRERLAMKGADRPDLAPYTDRVTQAIERAGPALAKDIHTQAWVITYMRDFAKLLPQEAQVRLIRSFLRATGIDEQRLAYLTGLQNLRDLRAALRAQYSTPGPRLPHEEVYPTDGWLGAYLRYCQETTVPMAYHFWTAVSILGSAARRNVYTNIGGGLYTYPNHYVIIVGPSALGKSTAVDTIGMPLLERANDIVDYIAWSQANDVIASLGGVDPKIEDRQVYILPSQTSDAAIVKNLALGARTIEFDGITRTVHSRQSIGFLANDELITLLGENQYKADNVIALLTDFHACKDRPRGRDAATRDYGIMRDLCLTFVGASTVDWLNKSITDAAFEGGFMSRVMYIHRTTGANERYFERTAPELDPAVAEMLSRCLVPWMLLPTELECDIPEDAMESVFVPFKRACEEFERHPKDTRLVPYYRRRLSHMIKLSMVLCISKITSSFGAKEPTEVDLEGLGHLTLSSDILEEAIRILEYEEKFLPECFSSLGKHTDGEDYERMRQWLIAANKRAGAIPIPYPTFRTFIRERFGNRVGTNLVQEAQSLGDIHIEDVPQKRPGRRPRWVWDTHGVRPGFEWAEFKAELKQD